ncbi:MAG: hypothetical protein WBN03_17235, partial [Desulfobacterales bacterium]
MQRASLVSLNAVKKRSSNAIIFGLMEVHDKVAQNVNPQLLEDIMWQKYQISKNDASEKLHIRE